MKEITVNELDEKLKSKAEIILLDVREVSERKFGTIRGEEDIVIPVGELESRFSELADFKDKEIVVYCRTGGRSMRACKFLERQGFFNVANLIGGILAWKEIDDTVEVY
ncbi:rhodanese-like domain-containing protein [archaeon]|jgi:sulfur-carrier protein adenylyltransferase/sulfurtransferase|nr:rhodanese-like domain-containing protein [archaeon]MBT6697481.1 rhodanese-like domain-containing protein [archaeon]